MLSAADPHSGNVEYLFALVKALQPQHSEHGIKAAENIRVLVELLQNDPI